MKTSYLTNIILLLIIVALFAVSQQQDPAHPVETSLTNIQARNDKKITIRRQDSTDIELQQTKSHWQLTHPIQAPANTTRINLLLSLLTTTPHRETIANNNEFLAQLGLYPETLSLQLDQHHFTFGDLEPISKGRYILYNDTVYLIDDHISSLLKVNAASFIDNQLIAKTTPITQLKMPLLTNNKLVDELIITNNSSAEISSSPAYSSGTLNKLVQQWQQVTALQVTSSQHQLPQANKVLLWTKNSASPTEMLIQLDERKLIITNINKQLSYHFPAAVATQLFLSTNDLN